ncbi:652_t:CDS:2 [Ambispora gerdemannii]|uniref:652_t:CDS:1 n=1 Tax=Ambispora gerdemannii TaxID=144530 RepID=A0A9N9A246_9GLOM|nr:652_t:CDS:2 [Ambispora gerdemannii]
MALEFLTFLSRDFTRLLDTACDHDVEIQVGEKDDVQTYKAHSLILRARSAYFATALSNEWARTEDNNNSILSFKKPNISPFVFGVILRYIYGGMIYLTKYNGAEVLDLLIAADELGLTDLFDHIQNHLINEKADWIREHFALAHRIAYQHNSFWKLQQFIQMIREKHPEVVFKAVDFTALEEDMLVSLLSRDDLAIDEVDLWARIMDWGLAQMPPFTFDISQWRQNEFAALEKLLHKLIPHIRFFHFSSEDFDERVVPFKTVLPRRLYRDVCNYLLHPGDTSKIKTPITPPRLGSWNWLVMNMKPTQIDSILINVKHAALAAIWIDQKNIESNAKSGPAWGDGDLCLLGHNYRESRLSHARQCDYEQKIRSSSETFSVDEYEVFQVIRTNGMSKDY